jgi:hypothetical protein
MDKLIVVDGKKDGKKHIVTYDNSELILDSLVESVNDGKRDIKDAYRDYIELLPYLYRNLITDFLSNVADELDKRYGRAIQKDIFDKSFFPGFCEVERKIIKDTISFFNRIGAIEKISDRKINGHDIKLNLAFIAYPDFREDYNLLVDKRFIIETTGGPRWQKTKKSLAEYFGYQKEYTENKWVILEGLFDVKNLKNHFSTNGGSYRRKPSKDYEDWLAIKNTPQGEENTP